MTISSLSMTLSMMRRFVRKQQMLGILAPVSTHHQCSVH
ncbi:unnamed protein product [Gongylonema pulchrum]|uniref:Alternative protein n=1 Tax=Gongylonema pulchrum TaxID=637853 RepID=A0A183DN13_9BILA|nr:unnamed protein product [Gongylonema pulchrum]